MHYSRGFAVALGATGLIMSAVVIGDTAWAKPAKKKLGGLPVSVVEELRSSERDVRGLATDDPRLTVMFDAGTWGRLTKAHRVALLKHMPSVVREARGEPFRYLGTSGNVLVSHVAKIQQLRDGQWEFVLAKDTGEVDAMLGLPIVDYKTIVCGNDVSYCHGERLSSFAGK